MIKPLMVILIIGAFFVGLALLIYMCAKNEYSFSYQSTKRKFEIYPNKENLKFIPNQSNE